MLVALEMYIKRDHDAEWKQWVGRCEHIADRVSKIPGVTATVQREAAPTLSNRSPKVTIRWDTQKLGLTGQEAARILYEGEPRITLNGGQSRNAPGESNVSIVSSMMAAGDEKIVAEKIYRVLSEPRTPKPSEPAAEPAASIAGRWNVEIQYAAGASTHILNLQQNGNRLEGLHQGNFLTRDISGTISGDSITLASSVTERHGDALTYRFTGKIAGETMTGSLDMGEYLGATWTARRPASPVRPT
jgi:L-seryl-tRNA(Ser) seleniumtransferase